jgi:hypothetical protein
VSFGASGKARRTIGETIERPDRWPFAIGTTVLAVLMAIAWMNKRSAGTLQEIDRLEKNPVVALRKDPPSLTPAQRLSVWFLTSFLGATAVGFLVGASSRK